MKKQGPPPLLDESLVTRKRKDAPPAPAESRGKKRRTEVKAAPPKKAAAVAPINGSAPKSKAKPSKKFVPPPPSDSDDEVSSEEASDSADGIDDPDVIENGLDGVNVTGLDALGTDSELDDLDEDDEFLESGSDVVDSDTEVRKVGMWSDDEDEDDIEEKLTAANIEGLSRKLDMQQAIEQAEADAEMEEAMQTNIMGDKPKVLEDEEDEEGRPISKLVTQDLQLLRTRLNDTVRVLDDFKNLAEPGRSRADYRAQMLKDICAYYGYSEFLADKLMNLFPPREAFACEYMTLLP